MGRNKRRTILAHDSIHGLDLEMDSIEECDFLQWLCEAYVLGIISGFQYQSRTFQLFESKNYLTVEGKSRSLFREHVYSPDFILQFSPSKFIDLAKEFKIPQSALDQSTADVYIDTKGTFARADGGRSFSINQKWVYDKFQTYVYKLVPKEFFQKFGVPEACRLTAKTKKPRKMYIGFLGIKDKFGL